MARYAYDGFFPAHSPNQIIGQNLNLAERLEVAGGLVALPSTVVALVGLASCHFGPISSSGFGFWDSALMTLIVLVVMVIGGAGLSALLLGNGGDDVLVGAFAVLTAVLGLVELEMASARLGLVASIVGIASLGLVLVARLIAWRWPKSPRPAEQ